MDSQSQGEGGAYIVVHLPNQPQALLQKLIPNRNHILSYRYALSLHLWQMNKPP